MITILKRYDRCYDESGRLVEVAWTPKPGSTHIYASDCKDGGTYRYLPERLTKAVPGSWNYEDHKRLLARDAEVGLVDYTADVEACPGCGIKPGEGINPECHDPNGCGYWTELQKEDS